MTKIIPADDNNEIRRLLKKIIPQMAVLNVFCWLFTLIWGFEWRTALSFVIGFAYMVVCYEYLGRTINRTISVGDVKKAKIAMTRCYAVRFAGLFALGAVSLGLGIFNIVGILLPQFYPKIVLAINEFTGKRENK